MCYVETGEAKKQISENWRTYFDGEDKMEVLKYLVVIWKGNDGSAHTEYQGWVDLTMCIGIRISLIWLVSCIYEILR